MPSNLSQVEVNAALNAVENSVRGSPDHGDFIAHRNRYQCDLFRIAEHYQEGAILEIGAFPYHLTMSLHKLAYPCIGVDLTPERAANRIQQEGLDVRKCDIEKEPLPFPSESVDLIVFNEVLEHLRVDPLFTLSEINRVMRPSGTLLLTTPNLYAIQRIVKLILGRGFNDPLSEFMKLRRIGHMGHIREYSATEVQRFLGFAGFQVKNLSFEHYYFPRTKRGMAARLLFGILPRRFRSFQVVAASKIRPSPHLTPL